MKPKPRHGDVVKLPDGELGVVRITSSTLYAVEGYDGTWHVLRCRPAHSDWETRSEEWVMEPPREDEVTGWIEFKKNKRPHLHFVWPKRAVNEQNVKDNVYPENEDEDEEDDEA